MQDSAQQPECLPTLTQQSEICCIFSTAVCANQKFLTNSEVIEELPREKGRPTITTSLCRKCCTVYLGRKDISVAPFRYMIHSQYEAISYNEKMSNTLFVHNVVEAYRNLQKSIGMLDGTEGSMYVREAIALCKNGKI